MRERKEDMSKGMMHEGCKMNEKIKLKHKTKTLKKMLQSIKNMTC